jgi:hypothetical protein
MSAVDVDGMWINADVRPGSEPAGVRVAQIGTAGQGMHVRGEQDGVPSVGGGSLRFGFGDTHGGDADGELAGVGLLEQVDQLCVTREQQDKG